uniref:4-coumarate--CoA ligase n=1 Tax=Kalanchoe fedtschenkoi TaxID=63787 RepID=A0A7N0RH78_KALFE
MSVEEATWVGNSRLVDTETGSKYDPQTGVYRSSMKLGDQYQIPTLPDLDVATFVMSQFPPLSENSKVALVDASTNAEVSYGQLRRSVESLASGLYHALGVRKGDVVFVLAPNSVMYPTICLAVLSVGAILTTANPLNTALEIAKQVRDSGAKLGIAASEELEKLKPTGVPAIVIHRSSDEKLVSVEELVECCDLELPELAKPCQKDTAAILYSSGTTGVSKGVVLTHANFIAIITLLRWSVDVTAAANDVFLCFIPMFHIYGLAFFALGLFPSGVKTVVMQKFDFGVMLKAIQAHKISNIPAVPPVILGLAKYHDPRFDLSSLRRVNSGAAPLSKEVADAFRYKFPGVELRSGYGLTESCGAATFFPTGEQSRTRPASSGVLLPGFYAKVVDDKTGLEMAPNGKGELWLKSATIMQGYLSNAEATSATFSADGWLKTGDLCYFDEDGYLYVVDRIKELIKHNGYQVAPAELEDLLLSHPEIIDAAVIPVEDEEAGQIPMAYVVKAPNSKLAEGQVIEFVASQVAPYKKVRKVRFISGIPKSAAGKILRKDLVSLSQTQVLTAKL